MSCLVYSGAIDDNFLTKLLSRNPRYLTLCSPGGDLGTMIGAVDHLAANPTAVQVTGQCMSAAVAILASGQKGARSATPSTIFMIHKAWMRLTGDSDAFRAETEQLLKEQDFYWAVLGCRTRRRGEWWKKQCATGPLYFTAKEALSWGLIDGVA